MTKRSLFFVPALMILCSCSHQTTTQQAESQPWSDSNPFFKESTLAYQAPDFTKIKDADFKPALEEGMKEQRAEIDKIANNPEKPSFKNTLAALDSSGRLLDRVSHVFSLLTGANTNPTLQKLQEDIASEQAAHSDAIHLNTKLFKRIDSLYSVRTQLKLDAEAARLLEVTHQSFLLAGASLSDKDKEALKDLNKEEANLIAHFNNKLLAAAKGGAITVDKKEELKGLSDAEIEGLSQGAKAAKQSGYLIPLQNTTQQPLLTSLSNRDLREKLFKASWMRAERGDTNDTRATIHKIAEIRAKKAKLIGFPTYADLTLQDQMAKNPAAVDRFFAQLVPAATARAKREAADIQALIDEQKGGFKLEPWDWNFYAEQVRKKKYNLDEAEVKPYFELNKVLEDGVFYAAGQLYGLTFKERHDLPVYQKDVRVFNVIDKDSTVIGLFYCDYFKRDNKTGGAWMSNLMEQSSVLGTKPVIYNICNFTKPAEGQPALLSFDDVTTMFHEFGHALHGFFASQRYLLLSGTNVARDFVEFPSQFNEHWALYPVVLKHYAVHYKTGALMPQELVDKIKNAATFNQGYKLTELLAAASLDMQWHTIKAGDSLADVDTFEAAALKRTHLDLPEVPSRYRSSYFLHIWGNGYAAGYYAYLWTEMLDDDAFAWFQENGGMSRANGQHFRDKILSRGNTIEYGQMYRDFRGHDANIVPMEKVRGLLEK